MEFYRASASLKCPVSLFLSACIQRYALGFSPDTAIQLGEKIKQEVNMKKKQKEKEKTALVIWVMAKT